MWTDYTPQLGCPKIVLDHVRVYMYNTGWLDTLSTLDFMHIHPRGHCNEYTLCLSINTTIEGLEICYDLYCFYMYITD